MKIVSQADFRNNIASMMKGVYKSGEPLTIFGKDNYSVIMFPAETVDVGYGERNLFNAKRDSSNKGIAIEDIRNMLCTR